MAVGVFFFFFFVRARSRFHFTPKYKVSIEVLVDKMQICTNSSEFVLVKKFSICQIVSSKVSGVQLISSYEKTFEKYQFRKNTKIIITNVLNFFAVYL